jgi:adenine-specific DNA-methyltransferase
MGTKRQLASSVSEIVKRSPPGEFLDLFSGMCAVATSVASDRQVWTNDFQYFAQSVSRAHFCSEGLPLSRMDAAARVSKHYSAHILAHSEIASQRIQAEEAALQSENSDELNAVYKSWHEESALPPWQDEGGKDARLFRDTFAGAYFGLTQAIEIDALRYAIDKCRDDDALDEDAHLWLILALCVALSKCSSSTGHFAQPLTAKTANIKRFTLQRRRSIRENWLDAVGNLSPIGSPEWRRSNRALRGDALACLKDLSEQNGAKPAVIYADPPYTNDQYSRYYHVYDTLIRYDYPDSAGRGLYRPDREVSTFSLASQVRSSMERLVTQCSALGSDMVLSYPTDGLLLNSREVIPDLMRAAYGKEPEIIEIEHEHSTMGGSKGKGKHSVTEVIYRGYH